jgi:Zn finger protein HypA/HybF involved in hydrogenase expression
MTKTQGKRTNVVPIECVSAPQQYYFECNDCNAEYLQNSLLEDRCTRCGSTNVEPQDRS